LAMQNEHMLIKRNLLETLQKTRKSILLLGPRQTGKSTLMKQLSPDLIINLADQSQFTRFLADPGLLRRVSAGSRRTMIDEIQRIPSLLNTTQALIDEDKTRQFLLTGSSARKLRRGNANLLPGRVHAFSMGPLTPLELGEEFDVIRACRRGLLPEPYLDESETSFKKTLRTYAATYLKEEIQAESLTRNLEGFSRFFNVAASWSGDFVDFTKLSSLAEIERTSAKRYFEILLDTLVAYRLDPFTKSDKVRLVQHPRFYFFDVGVLNGVMGDFETPEDRIGRLFEHLTIQIVISTAQCLDKDIRTSVFRTQTGREVDLILEDGKDVFAIEIKATKKVSNGDFNGLLAFKKFYGKRHKSILVSRDPRKQEFDHGVAVPLNLLCKELGWTK
jgi:predicted AAA+ superfamily ATPase